jgi:hypothetical protein
VFRIIHVSVRCHHCARLLSLCEVAFLYVCVCVSVLCSLSCYFYLLASAVLMLYYCPLMRLFKYVFVVHVYKHICGAVEKCMVPALSSVACVCIGRVQVFTPVCCI